MNSVHGQVVLAIKLDCEEQIGDVAMKLIYSDRVRMLDRVWIQFASSIWNPILRYVNEQR